MSLPTRKLEDSLQIEPGNPHLTKTCVVAHLHQLNEDISLCPLQIGLGTNQHVQDAVASIFTAYVSANIRHHRLGHVNNCNTELYSKRTNHNGIKSACDT